MDRSTVKFNNDSAGRSVVVVWWWWNACYEAVFLLCHTCQHPHLHTFNTTEQLLPVEGGKSMGFI
jgi:hypothetical protein